jgi:endonuclease/exonuclease/phosphatase (EEP) superfamily protein YafD
VAAAIEIPLDDGALTILGMHPPSPTTGARTARRNELLDQAGDWIRGRVGPVLVVGDLNATPWSAGHRALRRGGGLIDSLRGRGLQPTWPDGWGPVMIPIDHALHTVDLAVAERRTGPATGSAHRPLIITVGRSGAAE